MVNINKTTVNLAKSQSVNLSKDYGGLDEIHIGLGWDPVENKPRGKGGFLSKLFGGSDNSSSNSADIDLDGWAAMYGEVGENLGTVYYGNKNYLNGTILHHGDNLTGEGEGDDEVISIKLSRIPAEVKRVLIGITIFSGTTRNQQFGDIQNMFIRLVDMRDGFEICRYQGADFEKSHRTFYAGVFTRENNEWSFNAIGISNPTDKIEIARNNAITLFR